MQIIALLWSLAQTATITYFRHTFSKENIQVSEAK